MPAQDFVDAQREHQEQVEQVLAEFHSHALNTVHNACQADLEKLEERLQEFHKKHESSEGARVPGEARPNHQVCPKVHTEPLYRHIAMLFANM